MSTGRLVVRCDGAVHRFDGHAPVRVARHPAADVVLADASVSRDHVVVEPTATGWQLRDAGSSHGTFVRGTRIASADVPASPGSLRVNLGGPDGPAVEVCHERAPDRSSLTTRRLVLGRDLDADVHLDDLQVSRRHAEVRIQGDRAVLVDVGSANGTFLNGQRTTSAELGPGDHIGLGGTTLVWTGTELEPLRRAQGDALVARHLRVATAAGKVLLDDVSVTIPDRGLVAVIGPSGAGKSTLLGALTGLRPAASGTVSWRGQDLYAEYEALRSRIGLVPQDDTLHPQLTVRRALDFAARLRLPPDVTPAERGERVTAVLRDVHLEHQSEQRIDSLSGGQRKRVSIALELLTAPPLLFLDEPTSGLDPGLDHQVMKTMRDLAEGDRVVVVVTHSVLNLDLCDRVLLLASGGRTAFYGPPAQLLPFFDASDYSEVFTRLEEPGWHTRFVESDAHEQFVGRTQLPTPEALPQPPPPRSPQPVHQLWTLTWRNLAVSAADRTLVVLLIAMPLTLALLSRAVEGEGGLSAADGSKFEIKQRLTVLVLGASLMGSALSVRELVKERSIYRRERAVGLSPTAYLLSKALVVAGLVTLQAVLFTVLALAGLPGPDDPLLLPGRLEIAVAVAGVAVALAMAGLAVSAAVRSGDQTMPALVALIMTQLVLCGGIIGVAGRPVLEQLAWLAPSRFGFAAGASTAGLVAPTAQGTADPLIEASAGHWTGLILLQVVQAVVLLVVAAWFLRRSVARRAL